MVGVGGLSTSLLDWEVGFLAEGFEMIDAYSTGWAVKLLYCLDPHFLLDADLDRGLWFDELLGLLFSLTGSFDD